MKEIREKIFMAIGEASMCWKPIPKGVFDSTKAGKVGDRLTAEIEKIVLGWIPNDIEETPTEKGCKVLYSWNKALAKVRESIRKGELG